jgi:hypothetical protein
MIRSLKFHEAAKVLLGASYRCNCGGFEMRESLLLEV